MGRPDMRKILLTSALLVLLPAVFVSADTVVEQIIARVNNAAITQTELERSRSELQQELKQQYGAQADEKFAERDKDTLRDLIDRQLLLQRGRDLGISADADLIKRLDQMRKEAHLDTIDDLEKMAKQEGVNFEDFKEQVRESIITQKVIGQEVGQKIQQPTRAEILKFYEEHKQEMAQPESVRLSEILITPKGTGENNAITDADVTAAGELAQTAYNELKAGGAFADVVKKYSTSNSVETGGDIGEFKRGSLAKEIEDKVFALKQGEYSDVIRTRQGFLILAVTSHNGGGIPDVKAVEPQIMDAMYVQKLQPALRAYLTKLREESFIDIHEGFVDTGASPNQTKPIVIDQSLHQDKKKKKKSHFWGHVIPHP
jgi:peptidyl-prolyl cis-trans isomerase SurA